MSAVRDKAIAAQRGAADVLARLIDGVADEGLCRAPAPGKWSVRAIIAHMAEDELASSWRYRQMIEHADVALPGFDQDE
ncbi:MAG: DinB family protein, partial [Candidatus Solibacter sp.]|nr:DinB family protein [Candidatus Solibacter sp.]